jgi:Putative adhesin
MKRIVTLSTLAAVAALALSAQAAPASRATSQSVRARANAPGYAAEEQGEFRWHGALAAGRTVEIKGINGRVEANPASGGEVEVVAVKTARRSNPDDVRIEVVQHEGGVTICAVYPSPDGEQNTCTPGSGGHMNTRNNDTSVEFTVRVPPGVRFTGRTVNGEVEAHDLGADVEAYTVNGSIHISTAGLARAHTVNGSINAVMGRAEWTDELEFKTVNGGIDLTFPAGLSAELEATTLNGQISTDFPLTVQGTFSRRHKSGTIGGGGRGLRLETVNGSVQIRRAS